MGAKCFTVSSKNCVVLTKQVLLSIFANSDTSGRYRIAGEITGCCGIAGREVFAVASSTNGAVGTELGGMFGL